MHFLNTVINGSGVSTSATEQATETVSSGGYGFGGIILYFVIIGLIFYFLGIRPQRKRAKELENLVSSINVGDWVVLDSGLYGKVTDISEQIFMVEFGINKGVIIPVVKQRVMTKADPSIVNS